MAVEDSPTCRQKQIRHACENRTGNFELPLVAAVYTPARQPPVRQLHALRAPTVFEGNQSHVVPIRAAEVKFLDSVLLRILNCLPAQERNGTQVVSLCVETAICVDH